MQLAWTLIIKHGQGDDSSLFFID